jgi:hypothetical protein
LITDLFNPDPDRSPVDGCTSRVRDLHYATEPPLFARADDLPARGGEPEPHVLGPAERRRRLRDRIETLAADAASDVKRALEKEDTPGARAAIKRSRDLKARAEALDSARP